MLFESTAGTGCIPDRRLVCARLPGPAVAEVQGVWLFGADWSCRSNLHANGTERRATLLLPTCDLHDLKCASGEKTAARSDSMIHAAAAAKGDDDVDDRDARDDGHGCAGASAGCLAGPLCRRPVGVTRVLRAPPRSARGRARRGRCDLRLRR